MRKKKKNNRFVQTLSKHSCPIIFRVSLQPSLVCTFLSLQRVVFKTKLLLNLVILFPLLQPPSPVKHLQPPSPVENRHVTVLCPKIFEVTLKIFRRLEVIQLRDMLRSVEMPVYGNKPELIQRLKGL
jgi:hypothetical protein